jgi:outer membrane protein OmpA-like peptidoglycan-associated protein
VPASGQAHTRALQRAPSVRRILRAPDTLQRAGDPDKIPADIACPTDTEKGQKKVGTDIMFDVNQSGLTAAQKAILAKFLKSWSDDGGNDAILVHGFASQDGEDGANWTLSCERAQSVQAELIRLGIPAAQIGVMAHGEADDFGAKPQNRRAVVSRSTSDATVPIAKGTLTPADNFAGHSTVRFGVGETIDLGFTSAPSRPSTDFNGLEWHVIGKKGSLNDVTNSGSATYVAPDKADTVQLELRVASGATAGKVVSTHSITTVVPDGATWSPLPGSAPSFKSPEGTIPKGMWGAGFQANIFVEPKDVSFKGIKFGEGKTAAVVTPPGSFLSPLNGRIHDTDSFDEGHAGNATTGTAVSPPADRVEGSADLSKGTPAKPVCGDSDFVWAIPWEFAVGKGQRTPFGGNFTATHHVTSTLSCDATIEKGGTGPFCRRIDGTTC